MGWSKSPSAFIKAVEVNLAAKRREVAMEALQMVVLGSPVDTGAFRGSHQVSVGDADYSVPDRLDTGGQETIEAGMQIISESTAPHQIITVQTNLPYAESLENGSSKVQAPAGIYGPAFEYLRAKHAK